MSGFRDFNDEGPGTFEWDYVLGGNTTGLFPEEKHFEIDGNTLTEVFFKHTGGGKYEPIYGDSWIISCLKLPNEDDGSDWFIFEQGGGEYRATVNHLYSKQGRLIVDIIAL